MTEARPVPALEDVFQELMTRGEGPDPAGLEEMIARYPQFAAELTDFAVEWVLQERLPAAAAAGERPSAELVQRAMGRLRARLDPPAADAGQNAASRGATGEAGASAESAVTPPADPFADRSAAELRSVASSAGIDITILAKLRDRKIEPDTVPPRLCDDLAHSFDVPPEALRGYLAQPPVVPLTASFKSRQKPEAGPRESFREAVRRSLLEEEAQARWLSEE